jgi:hypothetical protein
VEHVGLIPTPVEQEGVSDLSPSRGML